MAGSRSHHYSGVHDLRPTVTEWTDSQRESLHDNEICTMIRAMAHLGHMKHLPILLELLQHRSNTVRHAVVDALPRFHSSDRAVEREVLQLLQSAPNPRLRPVHEQPPLMHTILGALHQMEPLTEETVRYLVAERAAIPHFSEQEWKVCPKQCAQEMQCVQSANPFTPNPPLENNESNCMNLCKQHCEQLQQYESDLARLLHRTYLRQPEMVEPLLWNYAQVAPAMRITSMRNFSASLSSTQRRTLSLTLLDQAFAHVPLEWAQDWGSDEIGANAHIGVANSCWIRIGLFGGGIGAAFNNEGWLKGHMGGFILPLIEAKLAFDAGATYKTPIPDDLLKVIDFVFDNVANGFPPIIEQLVKQIQVFIDKGLVYYDRLHNYSQPVINFVEKIPPFVGNLSRGMHFVEEVVHVASNISGAVENFEPLHTAKVKLEDFVGTAQALVDSTLNRVVNEGIDAINTGERYADILKDKVHEVHRNFTVLMEKFDELVSLSGPIGMLNNFTARISNFSDQLRSAGNMQSGHSGLEASMRQLLSPLLGSGEQTGASFFDTLRNSAGGAVQAAIGSAFDGVISDMQGKILYHRDQRLKLSPQGTDFALYNSEFIALNSTVDRYRQFFFDTPDIAKLPFETVATELFLFLDELDAFRSMFSGLTLAPSDFASSTKRRLLQTSPAPNPPVVSADCADVGPNPTLNQLYSNVIASLTQTAEVNSFLDSQLQSASKVNQTAAIEQTSRKALMDFLAARKLTTLFSSGLDNLDQQFAAGLSSLQSEITSFNTIGDGAAPIFPSSAFEALGRLLNTAYGARSSFDTESLNFLSILLDGKEERAAVKQDIQEAITFLQNGPADAVTAAALRARVASSSSKLQARLDATLLDKLSQIPSLLGDWMLPMLVKLQMSEGSSVEFDNSFPSLVAPAVLHLCSLKQAMTKDLRPPHSFASEDTRSYVQHVLDDVDPLLAFLQAAFQLNCAGQSAVNEQKTITVDAATVAQLGAHIQGIFGMVVDATALVSAADEVFVSGNSSTAVTPSGRRLLQSSNGGEGDAHIFFPDRLSRVVSDMLDLLDGVTQSIPVALPDLSASTIVAQADALITECDEVGEQESAYLAVASSVSTALAALHRLRGSLPSYFYSSVDVSAIRGASDALLNAVDLAGATMQQNGIDFDNFIGSPGLSMQQLISSLRNNVPEVLTSLNKGNSLPSVAASSTSSGAATATSPLWLQSSQSVQRLLILLSSLESALLRFQSAVIPDVESLAVPLSTAAYSFAESMGRVEQTLMTAVTLLTSEKQIRAQMSQLQEKVTEYAGMVEAVDKNSYVAELHLQNADFISSCDEARVNLDPSIMSLLNGLRAAVLDSSCSVQQFDRQLYLSSDGEILAFLSGASPHVVILQQLTSFEYDVLKWTAVDNVAMGDYATALLEVYLVRKFVASTILKPVLEMESTYDSMAATVAVFENNIGRIRSGSLSVADKSMRIKQAINSASRAFVPLSANLNNNSTFVSTLRKLAGPMSAFGKVYDTAATVVRFASRATVQVRAVTDQIEKLVGNVYEQIKSGVLTFQSILHNATETIDQVLLLIDDDQKLKDLINTQVTILFNKLATKLLNGTSPQQFIDDGVAMVKSRIDLTIDRVENFVQDTLENTTAAVERFALNVTGNVLEEIRPAMIFARKIMANVSTALRSFRRGAHNIDEVLAFAQEFLQIFRDSSWEPKLNNFITEVRDVVNEASGWAGQLASMDEYAMQFTDAKFVMDFVKDWLEYLISQNPLGSYIHEGFDRFRGVIHDLEKEVLQYTNVSSITGLVTSKLSDLIANGIQKHKAQLRSARDALHVVEGACSQIFGFVQQADVVFDAFNEVKKYEDVVAAYVQIANRTFTEFDDAVGQYIPAITRVPANMVNISQLVLGVSSKLSDPRTVDLMVSQNCLGPNAPKADCQLQQVLSNMKQAVAKAGNQKADLVSLKRLANGLIIKAVPQLFNLMFGSPAVQAFLQQVMSLVMQFLPPQVASVDTPANKCHEGRSHAWRTLTARSRHR
jgi:mannose/fructose/N-acetylgalactosamine-specific phosphotransferase system component IIC